MRTIIPLILMSLGLITACQNKKKEQTSNPLPQLQLVWETDSTMTTCESVLYDKDSKLIFVSNINQNPWDIDHNGFISTIDTNGNIVDQFWLNEGLSGPKGMGLYEGRLYVNDINRIVEIDKASAYILNSYTIEEEVALNDIAIDASGTVYSSNSATGKIYFLEDGYINTLTHLNNEMRLNGLYYHQKKLYFISSKSHEFGYFDRRNKTVQVLAKGIGWGDGIVRLENGDFITSSWDGGLYHIGAKDHKVTQLLDLKDEKINTADIDYIAEQQLLIVPTFFHNTVRAYKVVF